MAETAAELRAEIERHREAKSTQRYGVELKARAMAYLASQGANGGTPWTVSRELGIPWQTLLRWRKGSGEQVPLPAGRSQRRGGGGC